MQILWVNMVTAVTLGLALAFEPTEADVDAPAAAAAERAAARPGRCSGTSSSSSVLFLCGRLRHVHLAVDARLSDRARAHHGRQHDRGDGDLPPVLRRYIYGTSLTWQAVCGTRAVFTGVIAVTTAQFAFTYLPPMQEVFGTTGVPVLDGLLLVGVGVVFFAVLETEKQLRLRVRAMRAGVQIVGSGLA